MTMMYGNTAPTPPARPPAWLADPLDDTLLRFWNGVRWTFHTAARPPVTPQTPGQPNRPAEPAPPVPALRPDIAAALDRTRGILVGSMKEVNLLATYLEPEEHVLALGSAQGEGFGVLACTNRRLLFLFVGILRRQFLHVDWNQAKHIVYDRQTRSFAVYTGRLTKRAIPALAVRVNSLQDARAITEAAESASSAPRLDVM